LQTSFNIHKSAGKAIPLMQVASKINMTMGKLSERKLAGEVIEFMGCEADET